MPGGVVADEGSIEPEDASAGGESPPSDAGAPERLGAELSIAMPRPSARFWLSVHSVQAWSAA